MQHYSPDGGSPSMNGAPKTGRAKLSSIAEMAQVKRLSEKFLSDHGLYDFPGGGIGIPYFGEGGEELFHRSRDVPGGPPFNQPRGKELKPYGLWKLGDLGQDASLAVAEGESDCLTLWYHQVPALGLPGWGAASKIHLSHLDGVEAIYLALDADKAGEDGVKAALRRLTEIRFDGAVFRVRIPAGFKDVSEWHCADPGSFADAWRAAVENAARLELPSVRPPAPKLSPPRCRPSWDRYDEAKRRYVEGALARECEKVGTTREGRNIQLNASGFALGQLVGAGALDRPTAERRLLEAAEACGLPQREARATAASGLNAGAKEPRDLSQVGAGRAAPISNGDAHSRRESGQLPPGGGKGGAGPAEESVGGPHYTDKGNGQRLAAWHGHDLRHVHAWKRWLCWDGARWRLDDAGEVVRRAKDVTARMYAGAVEGMRRIQQEMEGLPHG